MDKPIVLFDGVCNLCNSSVQFIIRHDRSEKLMFASLQGKKGQEILQQFQQPTHNLKTLILAEGDRIYTRSTATLRILKIMGGPWKLLYGFIIVPRFIRDAVYNFIARNRYKWFGKKEECWLPKPEWSKRFLD